VVTSPAVVLESVSKRYGSATVVDDVSFTVERGEIVGFLGPNGAGKTTTMRMIAGFTAATFGRVTVCGHDMAVDNVMAARSIGYLPERPPLYEILSVTSFLRFVAKAKGIARGNVAAEVERVAAACRLEDVIRREIYKLSRGYRQRVGLAQALLGRPDVLLLDEPTAGLDPGQLHETREVIRAFGRDHAVLLSTHILAEATVLCRRVAIINRGRLLAIDSPAGLQRAIEHTSRVTLEVLAPAAGLAEVLAGVKGVHDVAIRPGSRGDLLAADCRIDAEDGVEASIARAVASQFDLHRLERRHPTLENVFLHYVNAVGAPGDAV